MTKRELYTCDVCHTDFAKKEDAVACEKEHIHISHIINPKYRAHEKYPDKITVKFVDNQEIVFKR